MTLIEIRPHRWGWSVFEAPGVEPVFPKKQDAIDYAAKREVTLRAALRKSLNGNQFESDGEALLTWPFLFRALHRI